MINIDSIQTGKIVTEGDPNTRETNTRQWTSAFKKSAVIGSVRVGPEGIEGDQVADKVHHGGPDKAILCYSGTHYPLWANEHPELDFAGGGFGENLTLSPATESDVCIGDRLVCGDVELEISQPRQPCWKISRRWQTKTMTKEVGQTGRTGWYVRVISGGIISAGDGFEVTSRPHPEWTVARANDILFGREIDRMAVIGLMNLEPLSREWKDALA